MSGEEESGRGGGRTANTCLPRRGRCRPQILMPADRVDYHAALLRLYGFPQPKAGLRVLTLLRKEKVAPEATDTVVLERSEVVLFFCHPIFQAVKVFPSILFSQMSCPPL